MNRTSKSEHKLQLSIIIPCYNCERTLREAVESCYTQGFQDDEFEIVMVDDGSTDGTWPLMQILASEHANITLIQHDTNKGGGATRNTGIEVASAENIITFDSDDVLGENVLKMMATQLSANKEDIDGVVFGYKMSFQTNLSKAKKNDLYRPEAGKSFTFADIFSGRDWGVGLNFMFIKKAWATVGGYPTHHPLDTQGFGIRFLGEGFKTQTCDNAFFYHRQFVYEASYFERAYADGYLSIGYFLSHFEYLYTFSPHIQATILTFDIFKRNSLSSDSIQKTLVQLYKQSPTDFFSDEKETTDMTTYNACQAWKENDVQACIAYLTELKQHYPAATSLDYLTLFAMNRAVHPQISSSDIQTVIQSLSPSTKKTSALRASKLKKIAVAIKKYVT